MAWLYSREIIYFLNYISEDFKLFTGIQITLHVYFCLESRGILQDQIHPKSISLAGAEEVTHCHSWEISFWSVFAWHCHTTTISWHQ